MGDASVKLKMSKPGVGSFLLLRNRAGIREESNYLSRDGSKSLNIMEDILLDNII